MKFIKILEEQSYQLVGMDFYGDPFESKSAWEEENGIGELWRRFIKFYDNNKGAIKHETNTNELVEVHLLSEEGREKGLFEIFAGTMVSRFEDIPLECVGKQLPLTKYAVFEVKGEEIASDWYHYIYNEWLPTSGYKVIEYYSIVLYDEQFKGMDQLEESMVYAYIPIVRDESSNEDY